MSRLEELMQELCPDGVEYKRLDDACVIKRGVRVVRSQLKAEGEIPVYQNSLTPMGFHEKSNCPANTAFIIVAGAAGDVGYSQIPFWAADDCFYFDCPESLSERFLYHVLSLNQAYLYSKVRKASIPRLARNFIEDLKIPVPPLLVQAEIVRILDSFTELTAELTEQLTAELTARKKQYEFYRDKLLSFDVLGGGASECEQRTLGDIATVTKLAGFEFTNYVTYSDEGTIIALRGLNVKNGKLDLRDVKYIDKSDFSKLSRSKLQIGDMLFTYVGTIGQVAIIDEEDRYYLAPNVALIRCDKSIIMPEYMRYYFQSNQFWKTQIERLLQASSMKNIPMEKIRQFKLAIPSFEVQQHIVNILDHFDALCNNLTSGLPAEIEARQRQYEYYRDKLLTFRELNA